MSVKRKSVSLSTNRYEEVYEESIQNPEKFWAKIGECLTWSKPWSRVLDNSQEPFTKWYAEGELNACYNCVDRHVEVGKGSNTAIIYDSPLIGVSKKISYSELLDSVSKLAGALAEMGVGKGDRVIIYMPVIPEAIIAMLATARLGAIHAVVFGGFAACELCSRIQHCTPKVIIAANCGIEPTRIINYMNNLNEAINMSSHKPSKCIIYQRRKITTSYLDSERFVDWESVVDKAVPYPCVPIEANEALYILYTSGTTGDPKGIQRPVAGTLATTAWSLSSLYGLSLNDVWWCASDFGWVLGHSYMCYAPLVCGMTTVVYEGKPINTPDPSQYYRIIDEYKVNALFTVPTALRLLKKEDEEGMYASEYNTESLRTIFVAGEHCDLSSKLWAEKMFNVPVLNHWWQSETGHAITATCVGLSKSVSATKLTTGLPFPGFSVEILRKDGSKANINELGRIVLKLPLPPGTLSTLYKADDKFLSVYFDKYPGYYDTMDAGYIDEEGLVYVTARDDDIINVSGHRLSTLALENIILSHPEVSEACVVSVPDEVKGEIPFCFFVMKNDSIMDKTGIAQELVEMVREVIGPVASFRLAAAIRALPQTRSGKICRKSISNMARDKSIKISPTVVDPTIYEDIEIVFTKLGFYDKEIS